MRSFATVVSLAAGGACVYMGIISFREHDYLWAIWMVVLAAANFGLIALRHKENAG